MAGFVWRRRPEAHDKLIRETFEGHYDYIPTLLVLPELEWQGAPDDG
ncbi:MAG: hypothetical protein ACK443_09560 [Methylococcaceae bacterium]|jgi:hypothetical protein